MGIQELVAEIARIEGCSRERARRILLAHLTPRERVAVERVDCLGLEATADELGIGEGACRELWDRAVAWLQELVDDAAEGEGLQGQTGGD